jgi:hypothetical protein
MSKLYYLLILLFSFFRAQATTYYWIGGSSGNWNAATNWSLSSSGSPASFYPLANDAPVFDNGLSVQVLFNVSGTSNVLGFSNFKVLNNTQLTLINTVNVSKNTFYINTGSSNYFEVVQSGSSLSLKSNTNTNFCFGMDGFIGSGMKYVFNGPIKCILQPGLNTNLGPTISSLQDSMIINELFYIGPALAATGINPTGNKFRFASKAVYQIDKDGGVFLYGKWESGSLIKITGTVNSFPTYWNGFYSLGYLLGGLEINTPNAVGTLQQTINIPSGVIFQNSVKIIQLGNSAGIRLASSPNITINGDFMINQGTVNLDSPSGTSNILVKGNYVQGQVANVTF